MTLGRDTQFPVTGGYLTRALTWIMLMLKAGV
jgi:hypothetical protein